MSEIVIAQILNTAFFLESCKPVPFCPPVDLKYWSINHLNHANGEIAAAAGAMEQLARGLVDKSAQ